METIIKLLGPYEILTNLIPGAVFYVLTPLDFHLLIKLDSVFLLLCLCYFFGLIVNRLGSLVFYPLVKKIGFIRYAPYEQFVQAEKCDPIHKLQILVAINNFYRSMCSMILTLIFVRVYYDKFNCDNFLFVIFISNWIYWGLFFLFLFSYYKQTNFVKKRVEILQKQRIEALFNNGIKIQ